MGLKIMRNADGSVRETWHGRVSVKGVKHTYNLGVPIEGRIPMSKESYIAQSCIFSPRMGMGAIGSIRRRFIRL